jgi:tetratricopeptide (TPR) repeat protein
MGPVRWLGALYFVSMTLPMIQAASIDSIRQLIRSGKIVEALQEMEQLGKSTARQDPNVQFELGVILQELAATRAEQLERVAPDSPEAHELIGKSLESHQKLAEALREYQLAADKAPKLPGIYFLIGNVNWKQREFAAARASFAKELVLNPNHFLANLRMGETLLASDASAARDALPYLQKAAESPQASLEAHLTYGRALRLAGQYDAALRELKLVAARNPDDGLVHAQLAAVYRAKGNPETARKEMQLHEQILKSRRDAAVEVRSENH